MRKIYPFFLLLLFCYSCKKDKQVSEQKYSVTLNATGFSQEIVSLAKTRSKTIGRYTAATPGNFTNLFCYVFNSAGTKVTFLAQDNTFTNLGTVQDYLPAGTYTVYMCAGGTGLQNQFDGTSQNLILNYSGGLWKDTFYGTATVTVNGNVNQNITLNRIDAELDVNILDAIPAGASSMVVKVTSDDHSYEPAKTPAPFNPGVSTFQFPIAAGTISTTNNTFSSIIGNTITAFTVTITCYDASANILGTATVSNVTCQLNKKTILQGNLFGSSVGFGLTINQQLDPTPISLPY